MELQFLGFPFLKIAALKGKRTNKDIWQKFKDRDKKRSKIDLDST